MNNQSTPPKINQGIIVIHPETGLVQGIANYVGGNSFIFYITNWYEIDNYDSVGIVIPISKYNWEPLDEQHKWSLEL